MVGLLDSIDQRTTLVGKNRLELLLFRLAGNQEYGINVFKVREVLHCPKLTILPQSNPIVKGVANIRGVTLSVIDLSHAIGYEPLPADENSFLIISEYNNAIQGFLVASVDHIVNLNWTDIHPPPSGSGDDNYLTAVTKVNDQLIEIIDVEKILSELSLNPHDDRLTCIDSLKDSPLADFAGPRQVLVVDDSSVARNQIKRCMSHLGLEVVVKKDGKAALDHLSQILESGKKIQDEYALMISDVEMPEMDGYTLTTKLRNDSRVGDFVIILHTSLSGVFNQDMVNQTGADEFVAKFDPDSLTQAVLNKIH